MTSRDIYFVGAGGHAEVLRETLLEQGIEISGYVTLDGESTDATRGLPVVAEDSVREVLDPANVYLVNAIGSTASVTVRAEVSSKLSEYTFLTIVSDHAMVAASAQIHDGAQILRGAIVNSGAVIGANAIINSGAIVEHHVVTGPDVHVAPGAVVCGGVHIGSSTHVGAGATVIQGIRIGSRSIVGAGAVVVRDVDDLSIAVGVPARSEKRKDFR